MTDFSILPKLKAYLAAAALLGAVINVDRA
jgi:precorrin-3B methylase